MIKLSNAYYKGTSKTPRADVYMLTNVTALLAALLWRWSCNDWVNQQKTTQYNDLPTLLSHFNY